MTLDDAIEKLEFMKRAYQELMDASITNGIVSGNAGEIKGEWHSDWHVLEAYQKHIEALEMVIKALEQGLCEDAISRQNAIEAFQIFREYESNRSNKEWVDRIETVLNQLPPVNPQLKTGHWIPGEKAQIECDQCGYGVMPWNNTEYCPNCGARMIKPRESEVKE